MRFLLVLFLLPLLLPAQPAPYYVYFTPKTATAFDAAAYFHPRAQLRREREGLPPYDQRDLPIDAAALEAIRPYVTQLRHPLRWFNAASISATPEQLAVLRELPCVVDIRPFFHSQAYLAAFPTDQRLDTLLALTRDLMGLARLDSLGFTGEGQRIAIFDAGFRETDTHPALAQLRAQGGIAGTYDFYEGDSSVYEHSPHGTEVLSCMAGFYEGKALGCAPRASYLLARTEHKRRELPVEEDHWLAAAEWADRLGADIIQSSLTFYADDYDQKTMDGRSPVSQAATIAAEKGILVVNAMGNEGDTDLHYMGAPADAPKVFSVGGCLPMLPVHIPFSSTGPNAMGHLKPDLAAPGFVLTALKKGKFGEKAGTSFSAPLIAGLAAALWEGQPELTRDSLHRQLQRLGHFFPYYDYELGHGVPDLRRFQAPPDTTTAPYDILLRGDSLIVAFDTLRTFADSLQYPDGRPLYYHLADSSGQLQRFATVRIPNRARYYIIQRRPESEGIFRLWFGGHLYERRLRRLGE